MWIGAVLLPPEEASGTGGVVCVVDWGFRRFLGPATTHTGALALLGTMVVLAVSTVSFWSGADTEEVATVWAGFDVENTSWAAFSAIAVSNGLPGDNNWAVTIQVGQVHSGVSKTLSFVDKILSAVVRNLSPTHSA